MSHTLTVPRCPTFKVSSFIPHFISNPSTSVSKSITEFIQCNLCDHFEQIPYAVKPSNETLKQGRNRDNGVLF
jgi:hypothetical protein